MEQRPLRLGDIVDDYCPRERRITNHAIVAVVDNSIRQTRCTTCDAEHPYKEARVPRRRKAEEAVPAEPVGTPALSGERVAAAEAPAAEPLDTAEPAPADDPADQLSSGDSVSADEPAEAWVLHRRLIRATLPRIEGEAPPPRPIPEFTMHQRQTRGQGFRGQGWSGNQDWNGSRPGRSQGQSGGDGQRPAEGGRPGRRRSRRRGRGKRPQQ